MTLTSLGHDYHDNKMFFSKVSGRIVIEDDVWVGTHAVIFPGIRVGRGSVIAAGAVVTANVEPYTIVKGVPAKFFKNRNLQE